MENTNMELAQIQETVDQAAVQQMKELSELQLCLIGGGGGDVVFA
ncbi:MAG TPA: hypothetical protein VM166_07370 [Gemmatimonadaceae bacterium]|nr:hypothetical protein [Gemmatimonadaceae bacterium]